MLECCVLPDETDCYLRGAFSQVFAVKRRSSGESFAVKCIDKKLLDGKDDSLDNEIKILEQ